MTTSASQMPLPYLLIITKSVPINSKRYWFGIEMWKSIFLETSFYIGVQHFQSSLAHYVSQLSS